MVMCKMHGWWRCLHFCPPLLPILPAASAVSPSQPPSPGSHNKQPAPAHLDLVGVLGDQVAQLQPQLVLGLALQRAEALVVHHVRQALHREGRWRAVEGEGEEEGRRKTGHCR